MSPASALPLLELELMKYLITAAAVVAALLTVLSTRLVIPALILVYRYIEQSFAPQEPVIAGALPMATAPVVVSKPIEQRQAQSANRMNSDKPAPRKARRRKPSKALLAKVEAIA